MWGGNVVRAGVQTRAVEDPGSGTSSQTVFPRAFVWLHAFPVGFPWRFPDSPSLKSSQPKGSLQPIEISHPCSLQDVLAEQDTKTPGLG